MYKRQQSGYSKQFHLRVLKLQRRKAARAADPARPARQSIPIIAHPDANGNAAPAKPAHFNIALMLGRAPASQAARRRSGTAASFGRNTAGALAKIKIYGMIINALKVQTFGMRP